MVVFLADYVLVVLNVLCRMHRTRVIMVWCSCVSGRRIISKMAGMHACLMSIKTSEHGSSEWVGL